jgi:hypothetical protein
MHIFQVFSYDFILGLELYSYLSNFFFYHDLCVGGFQAQNEICVGSTYEVVPGNFLNIMNTVGVNASVFYGDQDVINSQVAILMGASTLLCMDWRKTTSRFFNHKVLHL